MLSLLQDYNASLKEHLKEFAKQAKNLKYYQNLKNNLNCLELDK
jgi:hypothetical protein